MKLSEYQIAAKRTCPSLGSKDKDLLHMKMGIVTELAELVDAYKKNLAYGKELDLVNIGEEIADVFWYIANEYNILEKTLLDEFVTIALGQSYVDDYIYEYKDKDAQYLLDLINVYLSQEFQTMYVLIGLVTFSKYLGIDIEKSLQNNIDKLLIRYPLEEGFTQEKALNRNLEDERVELEK